MDRTNHKSGQINYFTIGELNLLRIFVKSPWKTFTLREIKRFSGKSSHHYIYDALNKFVSRKILLVERKGNTNLYNLNYQSEEIIEYLVFVEFLIREGRKDVPFKNIGKIKEKIKNSFYSMIITGSYAEGKQTKKSDIDVVIIIPDSENKKSYEIVLKEGELTIPEVHGFVFTEQEFYSMLVNSEFNFGKETVRKHILINGGEAYYKILFRAIKNGFNG